MSTIPSEFAVAGIYLPPLLVVGCLGVLFAYWTARFLNHYRLSHYFFYPPLVFLAFSIIYSVLIGTYVIRI
jgi:hypothetical protein